jgi:uncharacterized secreted protein with C-terminal beta-propeller domain
MKKYIPILILLVLLSVSYFILVSLKPEVTLKENMVTFLSEEDFKAYLTEAQELAGYSYFGGFAPTAMARAAVVEEALPGVEVPERVSTTTVQVKGIDEPDIVKTDGFRIYFSYGKTRAISAFPPENLSILSEIEKTGDMFLYNKNLIILSYREIYGYDVSNPSSPKQKYKLKLNGSIVGSRLYNGKVYLVSREYIDVYKPCPIYPITINGKEIIVRCQEIYHPVRPIPTDIIYTAMVLDPETGNVIDSISFTGSYGSSIVYMSKSAIYVTYSYYGDYFQIYLDFLKERCRDIIPSYIIERLEEISGYNISTTSKLFELTSILEKYRRTLDEDERLRIENELENRMKDYYKERMRDLERTGIVKISLDNLKILATGNVPGRPLNQFSLDEYNNYLRIATTVGRWEKSENDVYVLDNNLNTVGSIQGLGVTERIYSVRFIGDKGYVVTFRETDPFFILDLSNPRRPELKGELKIPGYSSYLHPIKENLILGIGKEGSEVKVSLFDVSSPENPEEIDKYTLNEYWSDILRTHHAFLLDEKHEIFFLPGSKGGYVFSYSPKLSLVKTTSAYDVKRAIYIEDYLYIIASSQIVVLDENSWERVNEIELPYQYYPVKWLA